MQEKLTPLQILVSCFTISSVAGLAAMLRSRKRLSWRNVFGASLYSGVIGLLLGLLWYNYFDGVEQNYCFLVGMCGLAGLGGATGLDVLFALLSGKSCLNISISSDSKPKKP